MNPFIPQIAGYVARTTPEVAHFASSFYTLGIQYLLFHLRTTFAMAGTQLAARLWCAIEAARHRRISRLVGAATLAFVLFAVPIGNVVTPPLKAAALRTSDVGLLPGLDTGLRGTRPDFRFNEASTRIDTAIQEKKIGDPETVKQVRESLAETVANLRLPENVRVAANTEWAYLQSYESLSRIGAANPQFLHQLAASAPVPGVPGINGPGPDKLRLILTPDYLGPFTTVRDANPRFFSGFRLAMTRNCRCRYSQLPMVLIRRPFLTTLQCRGRRRTSAI